jgi:hypothetical protein
MPAAQGARPEVRCNVWLSGLHPWMRPFAEMFVLHKRIDEAAAAADTYWTLSLTRLWGLACPDALAEKLDPDHLSYAPWPSIDGDGWYFALIITNMNLAQVKAIIEGAVMFVVVSLLSWNGVGDFSSSSSR